MMINKRLIGIVKESKKYIAGNVICQWVSLAANIAMMGAIARMLQSLFSRSAGDGQIALTAVIAAVAVVFSLYAVVWSVIVSFWAAFVSAVACAVCGVVVGPAFIFIGKGLSGMAAIAAGCICAGLAIFLFFGCKAATKYTAIFTRKLLQWAGKCFMKKEEAR